MMVAVCWALLALIHVPPALALFRPALITRLYGVAPGSQTFLLLHHRAALFLVVVILCLWAMLRPEVRGLAAVAVAVSMVSFLLLWRAAGSPMALRSIALTDLIGLLPLAVVALAAARSGGAA
jgi:hypothetical protein